MSNTIIYGLTLLLLVLSYWKDKGKTKRSLMKAWKSFENILPQLLGIIFIMGILLSILHPETISHFIGSSSGFIGVLISAIAGSIVIIPGFVAFPMVALLLQKGAGVMQAAALVSTLLTVGIVTAPLEMKYFGKRLTLSRNIVAFLFSLFVAMIIGWVVGA
ncbi:MULTISPECIES: hypothetical protein [Paenibacillus]|uniref:Permease n=1 Tax=Paenibacillus violae TaxID=3077234 RepID=A0ABU3RKJ9_9BACL|nr:MULTISPECIES: hypothetical protein [Paenibacillus]MDU0204808.1 hypothetical protein [Paenibacillus sp. PFR10]MEC0270507.1 hypothetical protein [Paenibacillus anseongense]